MHHNSSCGLMDKALPSSRGVCGGSDVLPGFGSPRNLKRAGDFCAKQQTIARLRCKRLPQALSAPQAPCSSPGSLYHPSFLPCLSRSYPFPPSHVHPPFAVLLPPSFFRFLRFLVSLVRLPLCCVCLHLSCVCDLAWRSIAVTVAMLAQGTHWLGALTCAGFLQGSNSSYEYSLFQTRLCFAGIPSNPANQIISRS